MVWRKASVKIDDMRVIHNTAMGQLRLKAQARKEYKRLRKHLNTLPVGYPATPTGVELKLLEGLFTPEEARAALHLNWRPEPFEAIFERARGHGYTEDQLRNLLDAMEKKGCLFVVRNGDQTRYACHPLVVGMFELQIKRVTTGFYLNLRDYFMQGYCAEWIASKPRQARVIPINQSLTPSMAVAAYDDIRRMVEEAGDRIAITDCVCKVSMGWLGKPCRTTERREVCMCFRDYSDMFVRHGWGRAISPAEALAILDQNEKDGLILLPATAQEPQFVCSCCGCCCGVLQIVKMMPRAAEFVESNYRASLNPGLCKGCTLCGRRCHLNAIAFEGKQAVAIDPLRCIGCGLCVSTCPSHALSLVPKEDHFVPPRDFHELYEEIERNKQGGLAKKLMLVKAVLGFKV